MIEHCAPVFALLGCVLTYLNLDPSRLSNIQLSVMNKKEMPILSFYSTKTKPLSWQFNAIESTR